MGRLFTDTELTSMLEEMAADAAVWDGEPTGS